MKRARPKQHTRRLKSGRVIKVNKGVKTKRSMALNIDFFDPYYVGGRKKGEGRYDDPISKSLIEEGFDPEKTLVHGTSKDRADMIKKSGELRKGTFMRAGRGSFEDANAWARNATDDPRVVVVETEDTKTTPLRPWLTIGEGREERSDIDSMSKSPIRTKKIKILKLKDEHRLEEE